RYALFTRGGKAFLEALEGRFGIWGRGGALVLAADEKGEFFKIGGDGFVGFFKDGRHSAIDGVDEGLRGVRYDVGDGKFESFFNFFASKTLSLERPVDDDEDFGGGIFELFVGFEGGGGGADGGEVGREDEED